MFVFQWRKQLKIKSSVASAEHRYLRSSSLCALSLLVLFSVLHVPFLSFDNFGLLSVEVAEAQDKKASKKKKRTRKRRRKRSTDEEESEEASGPAAGGPSGAPSAGGAPGAPGAPGGAPGANPFDAAFSQGEGIDAILILDSSRSMQRSDPGRLRDQGAKLFLRFLSPGDRIAILHFDSSTKVLAPLTLVTNNVLKQIDEAIEKIPVEGNFTDLWSPLNLANTIFERNGRTDVPKSVILLSDGQMDPHPKKGTKEELTARLRNQELVALRKQGVRVFTLSLSEKADRELLEEMAKSTGGTHWYAEDVNSVHKIFSDLFLVLKQPQLVELDGTGFEIDGTAQEATFYISRKQANQAVFVVDPRGKEYTNIDFPTGFKWFRGSLFDIVTISRPLPGRWRIRGVDEPEGFATLLTDLRLQVRWPHVNVKIGERVNFMARLINKQNPIDTDGLKDITFYSYKVVNSNTGQLLIQGSLRDAGEDGDDIAGDGIYSASLQTEKEGDYKALVAVSGPTFSRQQVILFSVSKGLINLLHEPPNEFTGASEMLTVRLSDRADKLKGQEIRIVARKTDAVKATAIILGKKYKRDGFYEVPVNLLEQGELELYAEVSGYDPILKQKVSGVSDSITYVNKLSNIQATEEAGDVEVEVLEEKDPEKEAIFWGSVSLGSFAFLVILNTVLVFMRSKGSKGVTIKKRASYSVPEEIEDRLQQLRDMAAAPGRAPTKEERQLFTLVSAAFGAGASKPDDAGDEGDTEASDDESSSEEQEASTEEAAAEEAPVEESEEDGAVEEESGEEEAEDAEEVEEDAEADEEKEE